MCVVASALRLKHGSATVLEFSISSCWKLCKTLLGCVSVLSMFRVVLPDVNVHVYVISSFPYWNCFPGNTGVLSLPGGNSVCLMS